MYERVARIEHERRLAGDVGRDADTRIANAVANLNRAFKNAADNALLPPDLTGLELAIGHQTGKLCAGAGAARRAVIPPAGAEDKVFAVRLRKFGRSEKLDVIDLLACGA